MKEDQIKTTEGIIKILREVESILEKNLGILKDIVWIFEKIITILKSIIFILSFLIWKIFLWEPTKIFLHSIFNFNKYWDNLSESYKILILGLIGAFISGIIAQIIGGLILNKLIKIQEKISEQRKIK